MVRRVQLELKVSRGFRGSKVNGGKLVLSARKASKGFPESKVNEVNRAYPGQLVQPGRRVLLVQLGRSARRVNKE